MKKILCYIYENMADFEATLLLHRLRNTAKAEVVSVSESRQVLTAQSGLHYVCDRLISEIESVDAYEAGLLRAFDRSVCRRLCRGGANAGNITGLRTKD